MYFSLRKRKRRYKRGTRSRTLFLPWLLPGFSYVSARHRHLALEFQVPRASLRRDAHVTARIVHQEEKYLSVREDVWPSVLSSSPFGQTLAYGYEAGGKKARGARKSCNVPDLRPDRSTHRYTAVPSAASRACNEFRNGQKRRHFIAPDRNVSKRR